MGHQGDTLLLRIESLNSEGEGVARLEGSFVVFVPDTLPGELAEVRVLLRKRRYARAQVLRVLEPSPQRIAPPCPLAARCGGCQLLHASYSLQLQAKEGFVREALRRLGGIPDAPVASCAPSPRTLGYRNKAILPVRALPGGGAALGFYRRHSHQVVPLRENCPVLDPRLQTLLSEARPFLVHPSLPPYREGERPGGFLREAVLRCGSLSGESLLCLAVRRPPRGKEERVLAELHARLCGEVEGYRGLSLHVNPEPGNFVWAGRTSPFLGASDLHEDLGPYRLRFDVSSFFQVNTLQARVLFEDTVLALGSASEGRILELYSGVGSLTLFLAAHAREILSVEEWAPATEALQWNLRAQGWEGRVRSLTGPAETILEGLGDQRFDGAVLDPPRTGCHPRVLERLLGLRPPKLVYVSCNPATLARDLRVLCDGGYRVSSVRPFDLFPQTSHVETRVLLEVSDSPFPPCEREGAGL